MDNQESTKFPTESFSEIFSSEGATTQNSQPDAIDAISSTGETAKTPIPDLLIEITDRIAKSDKVLIQGFHDLMKEFGAECSCK